MEGVYPLTWVKMSFFLSQISAATLKDKDEDEHEIEENKRKTKGLFFALSVNRG